jgi:hypothetical protein
VPALYDKTAAAAAAVAVGSGVGTHAVDRAANAVYACSLQ